MSPATLGIDVGDAPHTGARLETARCTFFHRLAIDAPHTGARLETFHFFNYLGFAKMPPTRGHDLKQD